MTGGDDLEENFVLDSEYSSSGEESVDGIPDAGAVTAQTPGNCSSGSSDSGDETDEAPPKSKKAKLNWREASSRCVGSLDDQMEIIRIAAVAFEKFFPSSTVPFDGDSVSADRFIDLSEYGTGESRSARALFECIRKHGYLGGASSGGSKEDSDGLCTLIVTSSATRGMYLLKELKEFDKSLSPLPLFFHGGGRKKEQAQTHDTVIKSGKASVAVCLPSRLKAVVDSGILDLGKVHLVVFDLKQNEKMLNVLSMKDTMADSLEIIGRCLSTTDGRAVLGLI